MEKLCEIFKSMKRPIEPYTLLPDIDRNPIRKFGLLQDRDRVYRDAMYIQPISQTSILVDGLLRESTHSPKHLIVCIEAMANDIIHLFAHNLQHSFYRTQTTRKATPQADKSHLVTNTSQLEQDAPAILPLCGTADIGAGCCPDREREVAVLLEAALTSLLRSLMLHIIQNALINSGIRIIDTNPEIPILMLGPKLLHGKIQLMSHDTARILIMQNVYSRRGKGGLSLS
ncbi:hypothetical protein D1872_255470 [compost metagenome]